MIRKLTNKVTFRIIQFIYHHMRKHEHTIARNSLPKFGNTQSNLTFPFPRKIQNPKNIYIGDNVIFGEGSIIRATPQYPSDEWIRVSPYEVKKQEFSPTLRIGNRVTATGSVQIIAYKEIIIEDDVIIASNVFISDALHGYEDPSIPFKYQPMSRIAPIIIKKGSWIGQNVVILPGVTIGENSIIGANCVVTKDIPDKCIAVGSPAKIIKQWNEELKEWATVT